ncbi:hypothetical protein [Ottowia sp.]|uniref:hypothetical protein n=1 Tax=Ottowia sp. TaxID=1898956 RepID=UPI0025FFA9BA|nr:hypothetical protein [Ottowia sp.]MBK6616538.1 hypothetical protein [Ottowia sp.]
MKENQRPVRLRAAKPAPHPFYCHVKKTRKSAWETPEYLTAVDKELIQRLHTVTTGSEFNAIVYEQGTPREKRLGLDESFFWRIVGWPEGMSYMRTSETYRDWAYPIVKRDIEMAYRAVFTPLPSAIRALRDEYVAKEFATKHWVINDGLCDAFARDIEERLGAEFKPYTVVESANFMMGSNGDPAGTDRWDWKTIMANGGLPEHWSADALDGVDFGNHVWIADGLMHYDAECPEGVASLFDLPLFRRCMFNAVVNAAKAA